MNSSYLDLLENHQMSLTTSLPVEKDSLDISPAEHDVEVQDDQEDQEAPVDIPECQPPSPEDQRMKRIGALVLRLSKEIRNDDKWLERVLEKVDQRLERGKKRRLTKLKDLKKFRQKIDEATEALAGPTFTGPTFAGPTIPGPTEVLPGPIERKFGSKLSVNATVDGLDVKDHYPVLEIDNLMAPTRQLGLFPPTNLQQRFGSPFNDYGNDKFGSISIPSSSAG